MTRQRREGRPDGRERGADPEGTDARGSGQRPSATAAEDVPEVPSGSEVTADAILEHAGFVRALARSLIRDEAAVDDVVQETLMRALDKGPRRREALPAWLRTVVRNIAYKRLRSKSRREYREEVAARSEVLPPTADLVVRGSALQDLTSAVLDLPEHARQAVFMRYFEGLSPTEIGERLGLPSGTVRMRLHRAILALRRRLDEASDGDRQQWMRGLAVLAGLSLEDAREAAPAASVPLAGVVAATAVTAVLVGGGVMVARSLEDDSPRAAALERSGTELSAADDATSPLATMGETVRSAAAPESAVAAASENEREAPSIPLWAADRVRGRVIDPDGAPVAAAAVYGAWGGSELVLRGESDGEGWFDLPFGVSLEDQRMRVPLLLAASKAEFAPSAVVSFDHRSGDRSTYPVVVMRGAGAALQGRVVDVDGQPVPGAKVSIGERLRLGLGVMGPMTADEENPFAPQLAARIERSGRPSFPGHRDMRGNLGAQILDSSGFRSRQQPARAARSDGAGAFELGGLEPGLNRIFVTAPGFAPARLEVRLAAEGITPIEVTLPRQAAVHGRIVRSDGLPLGRTTVHAIVAEPWTVRTVVATPDGSYRVEGLPQGRAELVAEHKVNGALIARAAHGVDLVAGETFEWDGVLQEVTERRVQLLSDGVPLVGWRVEVRSDHNVVAILDRRVTDATGTATLADRYPLSGQLFVFPPGRDWVLPAMATRSPLADDAGSLDEEGVRRVTVEVPADRIAGTMLRGRLHDSDGVPLEDRAELLLLQPSSPIGFPSRVDGDDGSFEIGPIPPGRYRLVAPLAGVGATFEETIDVGAGGTLELGDLVLPQEGELRLDPADGQPGWSDLELIRFVGQGKDAERFIVFDGRIELPVTLELGPGHYGALFDVSDPRSTRSFTIVRGRTTKLAWPK